MGLTDSDTGINGTTLAGGGGICCPGNGIAPAGVGIGVAAEFVVGGKSWYTMVVKTTDGVETVGGGAGVPLRFETARRARIHSKLKKNAGSCVNLM